MTLLIIGLLIWTVVHFIPSIGIGIKRNWARALGEKGYAASFSLLIVGSLVLIVFGWRSITPSHLYSLPDIVRPISIFLIALAFLLFGAANQSTRLKRLVRHPQLTGLIVWSVAHLLLNGDSRSVILFGWLGLWALAEIILINRRDGIWIKQAAPGWGQELKLLVISLVIFVVVVFAHPYIAGVPIR